MFSPSAFIFYATFFHCPLILTSFAPTCFYKRKSTTPKHKQNLVRITIPFSPSHKCAKWGQFKQLPFLLECIKFFTGALSVLGEWSTQLLSKQTMQYKKYFRLSDFISPAPFLLPLWILHKSSITTTPEHSLYSNQVLHNILYKHQTFFLNFQFPLGRATH